MSSLSIGIQLESSAIEHYKKQAQLFSDPIVKKFYTELADWESGHYHTLLRQFDLLKEEYWARNSFSPF